MSLIPDKNLYVVSSSLRPLTGVWSPEQRFSQTVDTIKSIREKDKNSIVLITDASVNPVPKNDMDVLVNLCDVYYDLSKFYGGLLIPYNLMKDEDKIVFTEGQYSVTYSYPVSDNLLRSEEHTSELQSH